MAIIPTQGAVGSVPEQYEYKKEEFSKITENIQGHKDDHVGSKSYNREERYYMSNAELIALLNSQQDRDGMDWNNPFFYLIFIWLFASFGGGGFGGLGGANGVALNQIDNGFLYTNLNQGQETLRQGISQLGQGQCSSTYELASKIDQASYNSAMETQRISSQMAECCCATNRNIDALANQVTMDTCSIKEAIFRDGEATRALINANTVQALRDELQSAQLALSNSAQTTAISAAIDAKVADIVGYPSRAPFWAFPPFPCSTTV